LRGEKSEEIERIRSTFSPKKGEIFGCSIFILYVCGMKRRDEITITAAVDLRARAILMAQVQEIIIMCKREGVKPRLTREAYGDIVSCLLYLMSADKDIRKQILVKAFKIASELDT